MAGASGMEERKVVDRDRERDVLYRRQNGETRTAERGNGGREQRWGVFTGAGERTICWRTHWNSSGFPAGSLEWLTLGLFAELQRGSTSPARRDD